MKKMATVLCLIFLAGCSDPYQSRLNDLNVSLEMVRARDDRARQAWKKVTTKEADFISRLNDEQLAAYQNLSDVFAKGNPAAEELARRQLAQCLDRDSYAKAVQMMQKKHRTRLEIDAIGRSYRFFQQQGEELEKSRQQQRQAIRDYMLRESIRNSGR